MRWVIIFSGSLFVALFTTLFVSSFVSAASSYDDAYHVTEQFSIAGYAPNTCETQDIRTTWLSMATNPDNYYTDPEISSAVESAWDSMISNPNGAYAISWLDEKQIRVWIAPDGADLVWGNDSTYGNYVRISDDNVFIFDFSLSVFGQPCNKPLAPAYTGGFAYRDYSTFNFNSVISWATPPNGMLSWSNIYAQNFNIVYPEDYEGTPINTGDNPPETTVLEPEYNWTITKDENGNGILSVKYTDNIRPFLTGISSLSVDEFTEDWGELDESLGILQANPAGWADWQFNIGPDQGWFMFNISHNQQLDSPPWPANASDTTEIGQVYYQFFWDGNTVLSGNTAGCVGVVCNQFTTPGEDGGNPLSKLFSTNFIPVTGLSEVVTAPLSFLAALPAATGSCSTINFTMPYTDTPVALPCLSQTVYSVYFGAFFTTIQLVMTALTAYWVSVKIFGNIKDISSPTHDRIEVAQL